MGAPSAVPRITRQKGRSDLKLASLRRGAPQGEWAAFNAVGDPLVVVPLRTPAPRRGWWVGASGLAVVLIAAATARRRRSGLHSRR